jgi:Iap family predicted aminopeptidase
MDADTRAAVERAIAGDIWVSDTIRRNLESLCLECGGRMAGSDAEGRAITLIERLWSEYGLSDVRAEPFPLIVWDRGDASLCLTAPASRAYPCLALPYAPAAEIEGEVLDLGYGMEADFAAAGDALRGKLALVRNGAPPGGRPAHRMEKYLRAVQAGAAAFIFSDNEPGMLAPTGSLVYRQDVALSGSPEGLDQALPSVGIPFEAGAELALLARGGPVRARLQMSNRLRRATSWNVVGEISGPGEEVLVVCGHLDGHDISPSAIDNGSGVIAVTEIARALALQRRHLKMTVRFIGFGAEEVGMLGSYAYAAAHEPELDRIRFIFNLDCVGTKGALGVGLQVCPELAPVFAQMCRELGDEITVHEHLVPFSDHFPFTLRGVPSAFIATGGAGGRGWGHTVADTLDKVSIAAVQAAAIAVARMALRTADDASPWQGRRRTPEEVRPAIEASGTEPLLRVQGLWPF